MKINKLFRLITKLVTKGNKGTTAGLISRSFNLGTLKEPRILDKNNILDAIVVDLNAVMDERDIDYSNRSMVVIFGDLGEDPINFEQVGVAFYDRSKL